MDGGLALDAFGDVDVELDAVVAHSDTGGAIYGRATGRAEDSEEPESVGYSLEYMWKAGMCAWRGISGETNVAMVFVPVKGSI